MSSVLLPKKDKSLTLAVDCPGSFEVLNLDAGLTQVFGPDIDGVIHIPDGRYMPTRVFRVPEGHECLTLDSPRPIHILDKQE